MGSRYPFLDGIRGVAAILVLGRHSTQYWNFEIYRSYLAVDLFFLLSGFVIAFAYEGRLRNGNLSFSSFMKIRLIRLYPMYLLSLLISVVVVLVFIGETQKSVGEVFVAALLALFFLPSGATEKSLLFFLNIPYWSLFFELIVNMFYAALCPFLNTRLLVLLVCSAGLVLAKGAWRYSGLDAGYSWGVTPMVVGMARATFCILLGCLIFRCQPIVEKRLGKFWKRPCVSWLSFSLMVAILLLPDAGNFNAVLDFVLVAVAFPVLIMLAARGDGGRWQNLLLVLGAASYPVYVLHEPVARGFSLLLPGLPQQYAPWSGFIYAALLVALALWLEKKYDVPLRRWLSARNSAAEKTRLSAKAG